VIVVIVHQDCVGALEAKRQPPVLIDPYSPKALEVALQRMHSPAGEIHIHRAGSPIEPAKLQPKPFGVLGLNASFGTGPEEPFQATMAEAPDQ